MGYRRFPQRFEERGPPRNAVRVGGSNLASGVTATNPRHWRGILFFDFKSVIGQVRWVSGQLPKDDPD